LFAVEFARENSALDVGAVFTFDAQAVRTLAKVVPHQAQTASCDEREHRVQGSIPLSALVRVRMVGSTRLLRGDRWLEHVYATTPQARRAWATLDAFLHATRALVARAHGNRTDMA
jgi:hypothetical protein